jgi:hypothetical protein
MNHNMMNNPFVNQEKFIIDLANKSLPLFTLVSNVDAQSTTPWPRLIKWLAYHHFLAIKPLLLDKC